MFTNALCTISASRHRYPQGMDNSTVILAGSSATRLYRSACTPGTKNNQTSEWALSIGLRIANPEGLQLNGQPAAEQSRSAECGTNPGEELLDHTTCSPKQIAKALEALNLPYKLNESQTDLLFSSPNKRPHLPAVKPHVWSGPVPQGALIQLRDDVAACSPEFLFLTRSPELGFIKTIRLGCELCGNYSLDASKRGFNEHPPFTTTDKLWKFVNSCGGAYGAKAARKALRWVADGLRSPAECNQYLLLALPKEMGAYGLRDSLEVNVKIPVPRELWHLSEVHEYEVDLLGRSGPVIIEYDGADHDDTEQQARDMVKTRVLQQMGYLVIRVNKAILGSPYRFDKVGRSICEQVGETVPTYNTDFANNRTKLRNQIFEKF